MRRHTEDICPNCHQPLVGGKQAPIAADSRSGEPGKPAPEERETDHRGIALPRRTRVGGIITPQ